MRISGPFISALLIFAPLYGAAGQELSQEARDQLLTDLDALIIGTSVSTRCALFDSSLDYLAPVESAGADIRLGQIRTTLSQVIEELPELMTDMRDEANAIPCGHMGLEPFLDFSRQIGQDMVDIGLAVWREITIEQCNYFADDDFLVSVSNARLQAQSSDLAGPPERIAYVESNAARWIAIFQDNCLNVNFDPVPTLPGRIALAVPFQG